MVKRYFELDMYKRLISLFLFCIVFVSAFADVSVQLKAPRQAIIGKRVQVSYIVNTSDVEDFSVDDFEGFDVLFGPSTSRSSSFSMVNGKTTQSSSITFTYTLQPVKEGVFELPVATLVSDGKQIKSTSAQIEILPAEDSTSSSGNGNPQASSSHSRTQEPETSAVGKVGNGDIFMEVSASKRKVYEQESILLTYKLYTLLNVSQIAGDMPQLDGFHVQEIDPKAQKSLKYERVNGRNYGTVVWRQYLLYPQKSGQLTVPAINFDTQVEVQNTSMDPFDIFFGGGSLSQVVKKTVIAPAVKIEVMPLPTPKPENFSGAVGEFSISGSLTPEQLNANDAATLRLVVSGQGNMKLMKAPVVNFPKDFEVYDPKQTDKTINYVNGAKGNVLFDYVVVPRHGGKFIIPPVEFSYFSPEENTYKTLHTDSFNIAVAKAKGGSAGNFHEQEDLKVLNDDIHYIKLGTVPLRPNGDTFFGSLSYWLWYLIPGAIAGLIFLIFYRKAVENANVTRQRIKRAGKAASKRLRNASLLLKNHDGNAFYDEVMRALLGYAGDKLNLPTSDLNKENVAAAMKSKNVDEALVDSYLNVLSECEFARFAPGDPNATMEKIFSEASEIINKLDTLIKKA